MLRLSFMYFFINLKKIFFRYRYFFVKKNTIFNKDLFLIYLNLLIFFLSQHFKSLLTIFEFINILKHIKININENTK